MQRFMTVFLALCLGLTLSLDANAKRLGGGKSFGSAPSHQATQTDRHGRRTDGWQGGRR